MKNKFGFTKLNIVSPKQNWPNAKAKATSVGAYDIVKKAQIYDHTSDAINEFDVIFSLSARRRDINKKHISINEFLKIIISKENLKYGLMFGPEASGLSNEDLSYSNYILQIPTSKKFKSLNLSHSLTIVCYEIFKIFNMNQFKTSLKKTKIASKKSIGSTINHLKYLLEKKNFFSPDEKKQSMIMNINNLFYRFEPSDKELRILASIISTLAKNMTKRLKSKHKVDRRLKVNLWGRPKSPFNSRAYPPGQHGQARKGKPTDFGIQLQAKQKLKFYYGNINERQFRNIYRKALSKKGDTTENLIALLESRLDTVIYRGKFAPTVFAARQLINHGHIRVNKKKVNISSYLVKETDIIEVREKSKKLNIIDGSLQSKERDVPEYIKLDDKNKSVTLLRIPKFSEVPYPVIMEPSLVIEYYSR